jgi:hypothetical protein
LKETVSDKSNTTKTEGNIQAELGQLLQKDRSPEAVQGIEKIIQENHPIEEKVRLIKELDKSFCKPFLNRRDLVSSVPDNKMIDFDATSIKAPSFSDLRKARKTIKSLVSPNSLWNYLFKDLSRIKSFGIKNHIIPMGFLFFRLRFNSDLPYFLTSHIQKEVGVHLAPGLRYILQYGWHFLKKDEYNTLNLLNLLVNELMHTNFSKLDFKSRNLIDNLRKLEFLYLSLRSIPDGVNCIFRIVGEAYRHIPDLKEKYPRLEHYIDLLFLQNSSHPSFTNFILGANMIKYRRFIGYNELIRTNSAPVISNSDWECPVEIYRQIRTYLWEQEQEIKPILQFYNEVFRKMNYMPVSTKGEVDWLPLSIFWDNHFGSGNYSKTSENISRFSQQICELMLGPVQELLSGKVMFKEVGQINIFAERTFSSEFLRIENVRDSLVKLVNIQPVFPRERFIQLKQSKRGSIPNEAAIIEKIAILLSVGHAISNKLISVMTGRLKSSESVESYPLIDSLMIRKGGFFLPHENKNIVKPTCYAGMTLPEALHMTITNLLSLAAVMEDYETTSLIKREKKLKEKIINVGRVMHRLASGSQFQQLRELYQLDFFGL